MTYTEDLEAQIEQLKLLLEQTQEDKDHYKATTELYEKDLVWTLGRLFVQDEEQKEWFQHIDKPLEDIFVEHIMIHLSFQSKELKNRTLHNVKNCFQIMKETSKIHYTDKERRKDE